MKKYHWLGLLICFSVLSSCSSLPRSEGDPFSQALEKEIDSPISNGVVGSSLERAATTFPKSKTDRRQDPRLPLPPR